MKSRSLVAAGAVLASVSGDAATRELIAFQKQVLTPEFWAEGAAVGDFNKDGKKDVVSGPFWYAGPDFKVRKAIYPAGQTFKTKKADGTEVSVAGYEGGLGKNNAYSDNFIAHVHDVNRDGWDDVIVMGFPGAETWWFENPKGKDGDWAKHKAIDVTDNESPTFLDLTGDGNPEIVCSSKGAYGWAGPDPANPTQPWTWHNLSPNKNYHKFTHGLGVGDVNGDGRADLLEKDGWWEQPASLAGDPEWKHHPFAFGTGGAQMYAYDVDGDGRNDVITSLAAHGYGLTWFQNLDDGKGGIRFVEHTFMNKEPQENRYGVKFSQLHAIDLKDVDGDGLKDLVTGKRFWAHGPTGDPEPGAPAVLYWFRLVRTPGKGVDYVPHLIDADSGVGTQVMAVDVTGDGQLDIVVGNKKGVFVHTQVRRKVSDAEWESAQPKPISTSASAR
ncbi:MAG: VCBS repeat-containing protein [Verrucomicrobiales bacterium]|nr:VCBS repeat-containing protein [Verrucomicrobiales bacterium]